MVASSNGEQSSASAPIATRKVKASVDSMHRSKAFITLAAGFVVLGMTTTTPGVTWPDVSAAFDRPIAELGFVTLLFGSGYTISSLGSGRFIGRRGIGGVLAVAALTSSVALVLLAASPGWAVFLASIACLGFGGGLTDSATNTYVALRGDARAMGLLHGIYGIGAIGGPLLVTALIQAGLSWRVAFGLLSIAQAVYVLALWMNARGLSIDVPRDASDDSGGLLRNSTARWSLALFLVYAGIGGGAGVWAFTYLTEQQEITGTASGLVVAAYWAAFTLSRLTIGAIGDRFNTDALLRLSGAGTVAAFAAMWFANSPVLAATALIVAGFAHGPFFPLEVLLTARRFPAARASRMVGFEIAAANVGGALLPGFIGLVVGISSLAAIPPLLTINAVLLWAGIELLRRSSEQQDQVVRTASVPDSKD